MCRNFTESSISFMGSSITTLFSIFLIYSFQQKGFVDAATFRFVNKCSQTVWPAILGHPIMETTGFELPNGGSRALQAPTGWSGRFWGRTGCSFDGSGRGSCATGDCGSGQMECNGAGSTAATLAEFTLGSGSMDFYDVSLVDGYNLPVMVDVSGGAGQCESTGCAEDLNRLCPAELRTDGGGACRSACDAYGTEEYCCKGEYGSPATCKPSAYSQVFKDACPKSYSYAYDDATSTFTCTAGNYVITFCPNHPSRKSSKSSDGTPNDSTSEGGTDVGPGSESESGSIPEAMLADGSWLANLAIGGSTRSTSSFGTTLQIVSVVVHLASTVVLLV